MPPTLHVWKLNSQIRITCPHFLKYCLHCPEHLSSKVMVVFHNQNNFSLCWSGAAVWISGNSEGQAGQAVSYTTSFTGWTFPNQWYRHREEVDSMWCWVTPYLKVLGPGRAVGGGVSCCVNRDEIDGSDLALQPPPPRFQWIKDSLWRQLYFSVSLSAKQLTIIIYARFRRHDNM